MPSKPKSKWKMIFKGQVEDFDPTESLHYWKNKSVADKFREVTNLIRQAQRIRGISSMNVSRLLRTTAVLKRQ